MRRLKTVLQNIARRALSFDAERLHAIVRELMWIVPAVGVVAFLMFRKPPSGPASRGEDIARQLGCFGCHGPGGSAGIFDPLAPNRNVPAWDFGTAPMYVRTDEEVRNWILYGRPTKAPQPNPAPSLVPMPAYEGLVSERQVDEMVAYFRAVTGYPANPPDEVYEGWRSASKLGCFGCHGPSGTGGVPNPGSFKGRVAGWVGEDYDELVRDDAEFREWVLDGGSHRLMKNPFARFFLNRSRTKMPSYRNSITDDDLKKISAYIKWIRKK